MNLPSKLARWLIVTAMLGFATSSALAASFSSHIKIDESGYWQLVQDSLEAIQRLDGHSQGETKQTLADLASRWKSVDEVEVNGQAIQIDNEYLAELMSAEQPDLGKIEGILTSLSIAHQKYPQRVFSSTELASLHSILSRPEFSWPEEPAPNPINEWIQNLWTKLNRWLDDLLGRSLNISVNQSWLTLIASICLALVFYFVFRTLFIDFSGEALLQSGDGEENEPLTSETAFEKAQRLSRERDYRSAVRYLYLSALLIMDERGVLRYDRSKTNREYLRSIAGSAELAEPLGEVIEVFDNVWYGYHSLDEASFQHYSERVGELKEKKE